MSACGKKSPLWGPFSPIYTTREGMEYNKERERKRERVLRSLPLRSSWAHLGLPSLPSSSAAKSVPSGCLHSEERGGASVEGPHAPTLRPILS